MKTFPPLVREVSKVLGSGNVTLHPPTPENELGQSGIHTFIDDVIDIVLRGDGESGAYRDLWKWLSGAL